MAINKLHDEFRALEMNTGWEVRSMERLEAKRQFSV
jgi:hypothetical protein